MKFGLFGGAGGWEPHGGQREFLECGAKIRVLACGRRWGKTDVCAAGIVASLLGESLAVSRQPLADGGRTGRTTSDERRNDGIRRINDERGTINDVRTHGAKRHVIIAPTQDQANLLFERVVEMLEAALAVGRGPLAVVKGDRRVINDERKTKNEIADRIRVRRSPFPRLDFNGHRVIARSGHLGRSLRGNEATDIVVDEASYVPERLITEVAMPMLATTNGTLTLISTPCGMNHFWRFFKMGEEALAVGREPFAEGEGEASWSGMAGKDKTNRTDRTNGSGRERRATNGGAAETPLPVPSSPTHSASSVQASPTRGEVIPAHLSIWSRQAPSWESPFVSADFLAAQRELISERAFRVEYGAEFLDSVGRVFRTEAIDACLVASDEPSGNRGAGEAATRSTWAEPPFLIGIDWARYADYTAVVVLSGDRKEARLVCAERFHGMAWPELVEGVATICHRYSECLAICDATGIGDAVEGMLRKRLPWLKLKTKV